MSIWCSCSPRRARPTGPARSTAEYFNRLGREIIRLLDLRNADGFVFRVDMRLRPFGESDPLVVSLASLEGTCGSTARLGALRLDKGRARSSAPPRNYEEFVRPFVYRRLLTLASSNHCAT